MNNFAVVIPYYNGARFVDEAVASVVAQTWPAVEVILVDDGSRPEEARALEKHRSVATICRQDHQGVSAARNTGVAASHSEWIAFLDYDDYWETNRLEVLANYIRHHPECGVLHNAVRIHDSSRIHRKRSLRPEDFLLDAEQPCPVMPSAAVVRRDVYERIGGMDPALPMAEDFDFFLRAAWLGPIHYVDEPLTIRRLHDANISRDDATVCLHKNRVLARHREHYAGADEFRRQILRLNGEYLTRAVYGRNWEGAALTFRMAREQKVSWLSLAASGFSQIVRNRLGAREATKP
jgi:glycosyltransferase involved in cell wall biosynthesis